MAVIAVVEDGRLRFCCDGRNHRMIATLRGRQWDGADEEQPDDRCQRSAQRQQEQER